MGKHYLFFLSSPANTYGGGVTLDMEKDCGVWDIFIENLHCNGHVPNHVLFLFSKTLSYYYYIGIIIQLFHRRK